ncbi:GAP family protein [Herbiconiux sp. VKM Ac-2851]|uniref:GAP family protein n=1 Tax=Herbiconiux sp. VKM Ac-2851 TaxID=2739025 RepID=UPI001567897E|nr:GAP family protein [Herbiconiux sp. VKM Ac-2851]NQX33649.1 GAP family protein [Herbiconiux sp. VKM Ac-2851]
MADLIASLIPLALGIVMSPLAIMALVAVLLSRAARVNGVAFLAGWTLAVAIGLGVSFWLLGLLEVHERNAPPVWVPVVRLVLGLLLVGAAWWIYRKGRARTVAMAQADSPGQVTAAAPQLPGWLRSVETFTPPRSFALGLGIFILNPVDLSCAVLASLDLRQAALSTAQNVWVLIVFGLVGVLVIAVLQLQKAVSALLSY